MVRPPVVKVAPLHHGCLALDCRLLLALRPHQHVGSQSVLGGGSMQLTQRQGHPRIVSACPAVLAMMRDRTG